MKPVSLRTRPARRQTAIPRNQLPRADSRTMRPTTSASWKVDIYCHTPYDVDRNSNLEIKILGKDAALESSPMPVNPWSVESWELKDQLLPGRIRSGRIELEDGFGTPGGVVIKKGKGGSNGSYISYIKLSRAATELIVPCNSWVWADNEPRVFFLGAALPKDTPAGLKEWRSKDLEALKGKPGDTSARKEGERIFEYDVYNDLGSIDKKQNRPTLGSSTHPFPRRLRTGRAAKHGYESRPKKADAWWLPPDAKFSYTKARGFSKGTILAALPAIVPIIQGKLGKKAFSSFKEVYSLLDSEGEGLQSLLPQTLDFDHDTKDNGLDLGTILKFNDHEAKAVDALLDQLVSGYTATSELLDDVKEDSLFGKPANWLEELGEKALAGLKNFRLLFKGVDDISDILNFKVPKVLYNRSDAWHTDEEFGRQAFAGIDPVLVKAARGLPAGSAIKESHVDGLLEGNTLHTLFTEAQPRLLILDFFPVLEDYLEVTAKLEEAGQLHAGRALLFKRFDGRVVPVAIELKSRAGAPVHVYTPKDPAPVWLLAKQIISNLDCVIHQGYSHFCRCHAATEPYIIATYRCLSALHPVYQLLLPHFRCTLNINQNARRDLVNAGGVVESDFTPGPVTMEIVSKVYGAVWHFDTEGLPHDLKARGLMDADGNLLVDDYPYAEDGMLYWNVYSTWFREYLSLYYKSNADITSDEELMAWWDEIKTKGHPDKKGGWPELKTVADLVNILATITWITSAHHSAVNFVQYDFAAFCLNKPSFIQKPMPAPLSAEYKALAKAKGLEFEKLFLSYMPPPDKAASVALIVKLLSSHSLDEQFITGDSHEWIKTGPAKAAFNRFVANMKNVEETINSRNADPCKLSRNSDKGGLSYDVLLPTSPEPGVTARGVPYSISI